MNIGRISLIYNTNKANAVETAGKIKSLTDKIDRVQLTEGNVSPGTELIISVGGDGTVLKTAREAVVHDIPVAHINVGTLGFLGYEVNDIEKYVGMLLAGDFDIEERIMLEARIGDGRYTALNDIVIKNGDTARVVDLELFLGQKKVYDIKGDGLIVATPTGSTAYSLASGGPVLTPELQLVIITPISPHSLTTRPVIVEDVGIRVRCPYEGEEIILTADGQVSRRTNPPVDIEIGICEKKFKLVKGDRDFFSLLSDKLDWG